MYSELKLNTPEKQELARQRLVQTLKANPKLSMKACWDKTREANPQLFGDLQAADWMEEDRAEERERGETHGSFKPSTPSLHQFSRVQAWDSPDGGLVIQGAFLDPL
jgi:hypothetical protein